MESFFLAETTKYLYLLFDPDNFLHRLDASAGHVVHTPGGQCLLDTGGYVFNTEAHPIDAASLYCCSAEKRRDDVALLDLQTNANLVQLLNLTVADPLLQELGALDEATRRDLVQSLPRSGLGEEHLEEFDYGVGIRENATALTCAAPPFHARFTIYGEMALSGEADRL